MQPLNQVVMSEGLFASPAILGKEIVFQIFIVPAEVSLSDETSTVTGW